MKKIPTIFIRDPDNRRSLLDDINPDCQWVFDGEGVATQKYDGTCCLIENGILYKRREIKKGKLEPEGFIIAGFDRLTGKTVGWVVVDTESKEDQWHTEAITAYLPDGTYELCGPKIQGNPEKLSRHILLSHSQATHYQGIKRTYDGIKDFLYEKDIEGLVFHHTDGRMAKIKKRDFGLTRDPK